MTEIILDALLDTAKAMPFLLGAYLLLEFLAHNAGDKIKQCLKRFGRLGAFGGALLGLVPQCGFSVAAVEFYADRIITPGSLLAVFIATSDEALPILLSPRGANAIMPLIVVKLVIAVTVGLFTDFVLFPFWSKTWERDSELRHNHDHGAASSHNHANHDDHHDNDHNHDVSDLHCHHNHCRGSIFHVAVIKSLKVSALIFAISVLLGLALESLGEDCTERLLLSGSPLQPLAAAFFGLVPNCAVSVFLADLHLKGAVTFGSIVAGLVSGAGVAPLVLFQTCRRKREAFAILLSLFIVGSLAGLAIDFLSLG